MNIERAKIAIDKMAFFIPEDVLNDLYKDHDATAEVLAQDESRVVFSIVYHDKKDKRILSITVKRNEINVHYNGTMQVFSHRIDESFYNDVLNVLFDVQDTQPVNANQLEENNMTTFTLNSVLDSIRSDVEDVLRNVSENDLRDMTADDVCNLLDENSYYAPEVIYYADGWDIVAGSSFNDYEPMEKLDFSGCENALDCIMLEARMLLDSVYYNEREAIASDVLEGLQDNLPDESDDE